VFGCAVLTGVGAAINSAQVRLGQTVAVIGLGGVGLSAVLGALAAGAREVIAIDSLPSKLDAALALGATPAPSVPTIPTWWRRSRPRPGGVSTSRSKPRVRSRRSMPPTGSRDAAAPR
jgi:hypothetical protein